MYASSNAALAAMYFHAPPSMRQRAAATGAQIAIPMQNGCSESQRKRVDRHRVSIAQWPSARSGTR